MYNLNIILGLLDIASLNLNISRIICHIYVNDNGQTNEDVFEVNYYAPGRLNQQAFQFIIYAERLNQK